MRFIRNLCAGCLMLIITYVLILAIITIGIGTLNDI